MLRRPAPFDIALRGFALFAGAFLVLSVVAGLRDASLDSSHWLIDARELPRGLRVVGFGILGVLAAWWGIRAPDGRRGRVFCAGALAILGYAAVIDVAQVVAATRVSDVALGLPPLSIGVAALFLMAGWRAYVAPPGSAASGQPRRVAVLIREQVAVLVACGASAVVFALALMACFGTSDYRRPADAVVVLGARAYADGSPSVVLVDRVRTAASLVTSGYAPLLVLSGGPGDGAIHETEVMRRVAIEAGVAPESIIVDDAGLDTRATAANATRLLREHGAKCALVVSHDYHLPRVKAAFDAEGFRAFTVPAEQTRRLLRLPYYVARETAAWWVYWVRERGT